MIDYGEWVIPLGGRGLSSQTAFEIEKIVDSSVVGGNQPPTIPFLPFHTNMNDPLADSLVPDVVDPEGDAMTFKALSIYGPKKGKLVLQSTGSFVYTPNTGYVGYDNFFFEVKDGVSRPVVGEVLIAVDPTGPAAPLPGPNANQLTPDVVVRQATVVVNNRANTVSFLVEVSPAARVGDVYRLTVRQQALGCDSEVYYHVSCYDITIGKC
jgi:hypothetical protein